MKIFVDEEARELLSRIADHALRSAGMKVFRDIQLLEQYAKAIVIEEKGEKEKSKTVEEKGKNHSSKV